LTENEPRSENNAVSLLKYSPKELESILHGIREAYDKGFIESADLDQFLKDFKFRDKSGKYWTIGMRTGQWYYNEKGQWIASLPPAERLDSPATWKLIPLPEFEEFDEAIDE